MKSLFPPHSDLSRPQCSALRRRPLGPLPPAQGHRVSLRGTRRGRAAKARLLRGGAAL